MSEEMQRRVIRSILDGGSGPVQRFDRETDAMRDEIPAH